MPVDLRIAYPPNWKHIPAGLSLEDAILYGRWRDCGTAGAEDLYFNVRMGSGRPCGPEYSDDARNTWWKLTAKRADLVMKFRESWTIVEFRNIANENAVGRLLCYKMCWMEEPPDLLPVNMILVTNVSDPDVERLCQSFEIGYHIV